jgi:hypothetical protein
MFGLWACCPRRNSVSESEDATLPWRTSSASGGDGQCVEVAIGRKAIYVRHSAHRDGPVLAFRYQEWEAFLTGVRNCEFDLPTSPAMRGD